MSEGGRPNAERPIEFATYPSLRDRAVVVTGGASGIGEEIVEHFARQGARVSFLDIQDDAAQQLVQDIGSDGHVRPLYLHCDLTNTSAIADCLQKIIAEFKTIDVLVNNAGNDARHSIE